MKSLVVKRSIVVGGHKTSVSLEDSGFWSGLKEIAARRVTTLSELVGAIDKERPHTDLSSALRLFVLDFYQEPGFRHGSRRHSPKAGGGCEPKRIPPAAARNSRLTRKRQDLADCPSLRRSGSAQGT